MAHFGCIHYVPVDLDLWPIFSKIGSRDPDVVVNICGYMEVFVSEIWSHKCRISGPVARQPALPWQPFCATLVGGLSSCYAPSRNFIGPPGTELLQFLSGYVTGSCHVDLWPFNLAFISRMSRNATWVINLCTKFELVNTDCSRVSRLQFSNDRQLKVPILKFFLGGAMKVKFQISSF